MTLPQAPSATGRCSPWQRRTRRTRRSTSTSTTSPSGEQCLWQCAWFHAWTACGTDSMHGPLLTVEYVCRLFDINPKGTVPIIHDLEADKWVPGVHAYVHCARCNQHAAALDSPQETCFGTCPWLIQASMCWPDMSCVLATCAPLDVCMHTPSCTLENLKMSCTVTHMRVPAQAATTSWTMWRTRSPSRTWASTTRRRMCTPLLLPAGLPCCLSWRVQCCKIPCCMQCSAP